MNYLQPGDEAARKAAYQSWLTGGKSPDPVTPLAEPVTKPPEVVTARPVFSDYADHAALIAETERRYFAGK